MTTFLSYHDYRYYPYERALALREAARVMGSGTLREHENRIEVQGGSQIKAKQLTYFSTVTHGRTAVETFQSKLESGVGSQKRQATRYSVHGLHEYKGKFNPQMPKALLNISGVGPGSRVLDPFCGSGTTLVEAAHLGATARGYDINPFAVFLANTKLAALHAPADRLEQMLHKVLRRAKRPAAGDSANQSRLDYLGRWFSQEILTEIEALGGAIEQLAGEDAPILQIIASNLLRDYSFQDPNDLRIRRRKSPLPETPFATAFYDEANRFVGRLRASQQILGDTVGRGLAVLRDTAAASSVPVAKGFDAAVTSPPYAMALPYIDTQRLSLVWLGLAQANDIASLESTLVGSREMRGADKRSVQDDLAENHSKLPPNEIGLCRKAASALSSNDGFRRKAVPALLYRYFTLMQTSFRTVLADLKPGAPYALVVGHNHTVLGGERIDIDTPTHLASLAEAAGWNVEEMMPLQTYQRWGYHAGNAVAAETLIILRRP